MVSIKEIIHLGEYLVEIFEIRSWIEILANDIKIYTTEQYMFHS